MKLLKGEPYITRKIYSNGKMEKIPQKVSIVRQDTIIPQFHDYTISANNKVVGLVSLRDIDNGVWVEYIANYDQKNFGGIGKLADQIEVEHCKKRGLKIFEVLSESTIEASLINYKRGKRFGCVKKLHAIIELLKNFHTCDINKILQMHNKENPFLSIPLRTTFPMYMPQKIIRQYLKKSRKNPVLKNIH